MLPVAAALRYVRARRLIYGKAPMPLSAMTYVWDAENAPGNALHPSLSLNSGFCLTKPVFMGFVGLSLYLLVGKWWDFPLLFLEKFYLVLFWAGDGY